MSGNKLLAENTIRRFMKLASVDTMTDNFISEMGMKYQKDGIEEEVSEEETVTEEEEINEEIDALYEEEEEELEDEPASEEEIEMDLGMEDPEMDAEPAMGAADMSLTEEEASLLIDLGKRLEEAMGGALDAEPAMDEPEMDAPADEEDEEVMQEALVNEVLKRVTKRIVAAKLKNRK